MSGELKTGDGGYFNENFSWRVGSFHNALRHSHGAANSTSNNSSNHGSGTPDEPQTNGISGGLAQGVVEMPQPPHTLHLAPPPSVTDSATDTECRTITARQRSVCLHTPLQIALDQKKRMQKGAPDMEDIEGAVTMDEHSVTIAALMNRFGLENASKGLTTQQASETRERDGCNVLSPPSKPREWVKFLKQMVGGFSTLLWFGVFLCFLAYGIQVSQTEAGDRTPGDNLYLGIVLAAVVFATACLSYIQQRRHADVTTSFLLLQPQKSRVRRNGRVRMLNADELVRGDVVEIKAGDRIPADIRLIHVAGLKVDNSSFTGEEEPQTRGVKCTHHDPLETRNMAFFSTSAVEGSGTGIVVRCGDNTLLGRVAGLASSVDSRATPIAREIKHFVNLISCVAILLGVTFFTIALAVGLFWLDAVIVLIGVIVASVPEGLLATITVCLTLTARRLATRNCLVKNLEAVETLGSTSTICSNKTGTLTQNNMTVSHVCFDQEIRDVSTDLMKGAELGLQLNSSFHALFRVAVLCNECTTMPMRQARFRGYGIRSTIRAGGYGQAADNGPAWRESGVGGEHFAAPMLQQATAGDASATDFAIFKFTERNATRVLAYPVLNAESIIVEERKKFPIAAEIPFNSKNKFQVSVHETLDGDPRYLLVMKGAPEQIITRCSHLYRSEDIVPLTEEDRAAFDANCLTLYKYGQRVLGFATLRLPLETYPKGFDFGEQSEHVPLEGLVYCGLMGLIDPPRPNVPEAVAKCKTAGIRVIMVTGDHPVTARAVAKQVGIIHNHQTVEDIAEERGVDVASVDPNEAGAIVIKDGTELASMSEADLDRVLAKYHEIVFARTSPQQKLMIVEGCQRAGQIVAVTGDGVTDAPALKRADIGVAIGIAGSDVAKQAADMILLDDSFASIVTGVEEGRLVFDNLKKTIAYTLTSNVPEMSSFLLFIVAAVPLSMSVVTVLCIDLVTDLLPAISLTYENPEADIMARLARSPAKDHLVTSRLIGVACLQIGVIQAAAGFFVYLTVMGENGFRASQLFGLREQWDDSSIEEVTDSHGQQWTYNQRKDLEYTCHTAFFVSIVVVQWADLLICRTRKLSIFKQGMRNKVLMFAMLFEPVLACMLVYTPGADLALNMRPLLFRHWLPALPFSALIVGYDEVRRFFLRSFPHGFVERETYS